MARLNWSCLTAALLLLLGTAPAEAGRITGRVVDAATGETLPGANVVIQGTNLGAATSVEGRYSIPNVPAGTYTLVASYIGYQAASVTVTISGDETVEQNFELMYRTLEGGEVVVTAQVAGQLAAINEQFRDATVKNVVSRDRIQELPDNNAAESIGRLPGIAIQRSGGEANRVAIRGLSPKFNTVTVNGVRLPSTDGNERSVDLSLVSSNILDGIEVRKAITPDQDADVVGGSIDLRLRSAPADLSLDILAQGGYTGLQQDLGNYKVVGTASNRFMSERLGVIATFNADRYDRSADKLGVGYTDAPLPGVETEDLRIVNLNLREETVERSRLGGSILLDYRIPGGRITGNTFYNQLSSDGLYRFFSPTVDNLTYNVEQHENTTSILTSGLGAEQDFGWLRYDAQVSYTNSSSRNPNNYVWNFARDGNAFTVGRADLFVTPDVAFNLVRVDSMAPLANVWVDSRQLDENQTGMSLNLQAPFRLGDLASGYVQTGGRFRWLDRTYDAERNGRQGLQYPGLWDQAAWQQCLAQTLGGDWAARLETARLRSNLPLNSVLANHQRQGDFLDGNFGLGFVPDDRLLLQLTRALQNEACAAEYLNNSIASLGQDYSGEERYQAGYVMGRLDIGRYVTIIPGVRFERDYSRYTGQRFREVVNAFRDAPPADLEELVVERNNAYWLPMVHLDVRPQDWLSIRLARTNTISRPGFNQYAPITSINTYGSFIQAANSLIRPMQATNYDASVQVVQRNLGLVGVSAFHKTIDDLILQVELPVNAAIGTPEGANVPTAWLAGSPQLQTFINNEDPAIFYGFELEWQTNFSYLPGAFRGLVLNLNYTRSFSETTYRSYRVERTYIPGTRPPQYTSELIETERTGRMPDQSAHIGNVTLGYDYRGFSTRVSYLYQSNTTSYVNPREPLLDSFVGSYSRFDISLRQLVRNGVEVFANLNNLNNRPDRSFTGQDAYSPNYSFTQDYPSYRELYGYTVDIGVRYRL